MLLLNNIFRALHTQHNHHKRLTPIKTNVLSLSLSLSPPPPSPLLTTDSCTTAVHHEGRNKARHLQRGSPLSERVAGGPGTGGGALHGTRRPIWRCDQHGRNSPRESGVSIPEFLRHYRLFCLNSLHVYNFSLHISCGSPISASYHCSSVSRTVDRR